MTTYYEHNAKAVERPEAIEWPEILVTEECNMDARQIESMRAMMDEFLGRLP